MIKGQCNCGLVSFEINAEIKDVYMCHCSICRRSTGTNGISVFVTKNSNFQWTNGFDHIKRWQKPGYDWQNSFCQTCGSTLPGKNDDLRMYVPAGLITQGDEKFKVAHHIWVGSKAPWDQICDHGKQHLRSFESEK